MDDNAYYFASSLAGQGIATITISAVGRGRGPLETPGEFDERRFGAPAVRRAGFDQNGDGDIDAQEGAGAAPPRDILGQGDAQRQTVVGWMQLVRVIAAGMDVDGEGTFSPRPQPDLLLWWFLRWVVWGRSCRPWSRSCAQARLPIPVPRLAEST